MPRAAGNVVRHWHLRGVNGAMTLVK